MENIKVVVREQAGLTHDTVADTPPAEPNLCVKVMSAAGIVLVRALRTGIQAGLAALLGGVAGPAVPGVSDVLPPGQFGEKALAALYIGGVAAGISALQNVAEMLAKVDSSHPEWRA